MGLRGPMACIAVAAVCMLVFKLLPSSQWGLPGKGKVIGKLGCPPVLES